MPLRKTDIIALLDKYNYSISDYIFGIPKPLKDLRVLAESLPDSSEYLNSDQRRQLFFMTLAIIKNFPVAPLAGYELSVRNFANTILTIHVSIYMSHCPIDIMRISRFAHPRPIGGPELDYDFYLESLVDFSDGKKRNEYFKILNEVFEIFMDSNLSIIGHDIRISRTISSLLNEEYWYNYPYVLSLLFGYLKLTNELSDHNVTLLLIELNNVNDMWRANNRKINFPADKLSAILSVNDPRLIYYIALKDGLSYLRAAGCLSAKNIMAAVSMPFKKDIWPNTYKLFMSLKALDALTLQISEYVLYIQNFLSGYYFLSNVIEKYASFLKKYNLFTLENFTLLFAPGLDHFMDLPASIPLSRFREMLEYDINRHFRYLSKCIELDESFPIDDNLRKFFTNWYAFSCIFKQLEIENFTIDLIKSLFRNAAHTQAIAAALRYLSLAQNEWFLLFERSSILTHFSQSLTPRIPEDQLTVYYRAILTVCATYPEDALAIRHIEECYREFLVPDRTPTIQYNPSQSVHFKSVEKTASESAIRLNKQFGAICKNEAAQQQIISELRKFLKTLDQSQPKNIAALQRLENLASYAHASMGNFVDPVSKVSNRKLLALCWLAIQNDEVRIGTLSAAEIAMVNALYEIHRGLNLDELGRDNDREAYSAICSSGAFNKLMQEMMGVLSLVNIVIVATPIAAKKLPIIIFEELLNYLTHLREAANSDELKNALKIKIIALKDGGIDAGVWREIESRVYSRMMDDFASLYSDISGEAKLKAEMLNSYPYIKIELSQEKFERIVQECATRYFYALKDTASSAQALSTLVAVRSEGVAAIWAAIVASVATEAFKVFGGLFADGIEGEEFRAFIVSGRMLRLNEGSCTRVATSIRDITTCAAEAGVGAAHIEMAA